MRKMAIAASLGLLAVGVGARMATRERAGLRVATFNIELFGYPEKVTDDGRLRTILEELDADVIAVQEIMAPARFERLVRRMGGAGRDYRFAQSSCGGKSRMHLGFVYDARRVAYEGAQEFPELEPGGDGRCHDGGRPGFLGRFRADGKEIGLLAVHFEPGGEPEKMKRRREQWEKALAIVARERAAGRPAIAILGDTNSTGFLEDRGRERTFIEGRVKAAGLVLATGKVECSEYWRPDGDGPWLPSMLDHVVVSKEFPVAARARVHGYCVQAGCVPFRAPPRDYQRVSDHCPVSVE
jgi:endonuclease/exonuclease/phosphatase family metal-dependent hydrolase